VLGDDLDLVGVAVAVDVRPTARPERGQPLEAVDLVARRLLVERREVDVRQHVGHGGAQIVSTSALLTEGPQAHPGRVVVGIVHAP
jgi:hypothetical protein